MTHMCLALASGWEAWREGEVGWIPGDRVVNSGSFPHIKTQKESHAIKTQRLARSAPSRELEVPWAVSLWHKRAGVATNQSPVSGWIWTNESGPLCLARRWMLSPGSGWPWSRWSANSRPRVWCPGDSGGRRMWPRPAGWGPSWTSSVSPGWPSTETDSL